MERLTTRIGKNNSATPKKAYEEYTRREPIDCITFCRTQEDCMTCPIGACFDKLADYEDAEEQERLITLPVPIGTRLYYANKDGSIDSGIVNYVEVGCCTEVNVALVMEPDDNEYAWFIDADEIGKNAFTSLEEARIRQKEREGENELGGEIWRD